ncbi:GAF domain-containing protein [Micromonospora hortensis]|uniref:GAF domain-containing protein n=1 Tax=Micromonospora hortensis TaxID=2911209 RepID=UPI001EE8D6D4|nr:GAF domain-containing protein [Micromonospora hortensis]MCG5449564.1 GAF domain-containing protein [Micromonospora hortensis]
MTHVEPMDPHEAFAELGRIRLADVDLDALLDRIAQLAKRTIPGASEVSVTLLHGNKPQTAAFTGELARALDEKQYERGYGPCLQAAESTSSLIVPDTSSEQRWPGWAQTAAQAGAHSSLSVGLPVHEHVTGALNIYATTSNAFDDDAIAIAQTFAGFAAVGLANAHLYETQATLAGHMQKAMENRAGLTDHTERVRSRLHPPVHVGVGPAVGQVPVHPHRPLLSRPVRGPLTPRVSDPIYHDVPLPVTARAPPTVASAGPTPVRTASRRP